MMARSAVAVFVAAWIAIACGGSGGRASFVATASVSEVELALDSPKLVLVSLRNTGPADDTLVLDVPDPLRDVPSTWTVSICDTSGLCFPLPHEVPVGAGETVGSRGLDVIADDDGSGSVALVVSSKTNPALSDTLVIAFSATGG
jgi:hypothetical protein